MLRDENSNRAQRVRCLLDQPVATSILSAPMTVDHPAGSVRA
jgi:hypothetical protein